MRTVLCALVALAALRPAPAVKITAGVDDVGNSTVCPIMTVINTEEMRLPRVIKTWRCAPDPLSVCRVRGLPEAECCHGQNHNNYMLQCVELYDVTIVGYQEKELDVLRTRWSTLEVAVGCACAVLDVPYAADLPSGPEGRSGLAVGS